MVEPVRSKLQIKKYREAISTCLYEDVGNTEEGITSNAVISISSSLELTGLTKKSKVDNELSFISAQSFQF